MTPFRLLFALARKREPQISETVAWTFLDYWQKEWDL